MHDILRFKGPKYFWHPPPQSCAFVVRYNQGQDSHQLCDYTIQQFEIKIFNFELPKLTKWHPHRFVQTLRNLCGNFSGVRITPNMHLIVIIIII